VSQPQISGGTTSTRGGMNHSGMLIISASSAATVHNSDQLTLAINPAPCLRSSIGKRR